MGTQADAAEAEGEERFHDWLIVGCVIKPHGVHGDIVAEIISDFPERLSEGVRLGLGDAEAPEEVHQVHQVRLHKGRWLLSIRGIREREAVEAWRGKYLFLPPQERKQLPEGYYYEHELAGLLCRARDGQHLGTVTGLDPGPGQTRLVVDHHGTEYLVPWVPAIVLEVDLEAGTLTLDPPAGLFDDDAEVA